MQQLIKFSFFITSFLLLNSCRSVKEITYFQEGKRQDDRKVVFPNFEPQAPAAYEAVIQTGDILRIYVSSLSPEGSAFFNETNTPDQSTSTYTTRTPIGYLVDVNGIIDMPLIGKIKLGGLTTKTAKDTLIRRLEGFLQSPSVRIYFDNFRVTILGEVARPGVYTVTNEKITIPEVMGMAGDLTIYGNRKNIMLIRESAGKKEFHSIDLTSRTLFESPHYYLHSNDVLYVEPVKARVAQSDNFYRVAPLVMSTITLIAVLLTRFNNE